MPRVNILFVVLLGVSTWRGRAQIGMRAELPYGKLPTFRGFLVLSGYFPSWVMERVRTLHRPHQDKKNPRKQTVCGDSSEGWSV